MLQSYADGVNDYLENVGYFGDEISAFYLQPEFWINGKVTPTKYYQMKEADKERVQVVKAWQIEDSLAIMKVNSFFMGLVGWKKQALRMHLADKKGFTTEQID